jgi:hypothetical protein
MGMFRGERCIVLDDLGDRLHIAYLGHDAYHAEQLGFWQVDRGVFELVTPREEVTEIIEERLDYPHRAAPRDPLAGEPGPSAGPRPENFATGPLPQPGYPLDGRSGDAHRDLAVIVPATEPPLPLEAAALRAASARTLQQPEVPPAPAAAPPAQASPRRRRSALNRLATQRIFSELASLAAIPPSAYAVGEEVDGAMCLIQTPEGFEVFNAAAGSRHEVRLFDDEESAYFYLFGVLAAEAVRTGRLAPRD